MPLVRTPLCESVDLAAGLDFADERLTEPLVLRLSGTEGASTEIEIRLPEVRREEIDPFTVAMGLAMWSTITLPLPDGATGLTGEVVSPSVGSVHVLSLGVHDGLRSRSWSEVLFQDVENHV